MDVFPFGKKTPQTQITKMLQFPNYTHLLMRPVSSFHQAIVQITNQNFVVKFCYILDYVTFFNVTFFNYLIIMPWNNFLTHQNKFNKMLEILEILSRHPVT
jgi:hypothetical protein